MGGAGNPDWSDVKLTYENVSISITDKLVVITVGDKPPVSISRNGEKHDT